MRSDNADDHPLIIPNYFDHPEDLREFIEGMKFTKKLAAAMKHLNASTYRGKEPGCEQHELGENFKNLKIVFPKPKFQSKIGSFKTKTSLLYLIDI